MTTTVSELMVHLDLSQDTGRGIWLGGPVSRRKQEGLGIEVSRREVSCLILQLLHLYSRHNRIMLRRLLVNIFTVLLF